MPPGTRLVAADPKATTDPSAETSTPWLVPLPGTPPVETDTFSVPGSAAALAGSVSARVDANRAVAAAPAHPPVRRVMSQT